MLSSSLLQSALPPNTSTLGHAFKMPEKLSINQLKQKQHYAISTPASVPSDNIAATFNNNANNSMLGASAAPTHHAVDCALSSNSDSSNSDNSLSLGCLAIMPVTTSASMNPLPNVKKSNSETSANDLLKVLTISDELLSGTIDPTSTETSTSEASSLSRAQFLEVKPLTDIKVAIENIKPGKVVSLLSTINFYNFHKN